MRGRRRQESRLRRTSRRLPAPPTIAPFPEQRRDHPSEPGPPRFPAGRRPRTGRPDPRRRAAARGPRRGAGHRPAFGCVVSRLHGGAGALPAYVSLDRPTTDEFEFEKPYYAGSAHAPFRPFGSALDDLTPVKDLGQLQDRKQLLAA